MCTPPSTILSEGCHLSRSIITVIAQMLYFFIIGSKIASESNTSIKITPYNNISVLMKFILISIFDILICRCTYTSTDTYEEL